MTCQGIVVFKGVTTRSGGTFKNSQGQEINYDESYVLKFDEIKGDTSDERKLKFPISNKALYQKLKELDLYTKINVLFDIQLSNNSCKLIPQDFNFDIE